jgi:hypothetical protein
VLSTVRGIGSQRTSVGKKLGTLEEKLSALEEQFTKVETERWFDEHGSGYRPELPRIDQRTGKI